MEKCHMLVLLLSAGIFVLVADPYENEDVSLDILLRYEHEGERDALFTKKTSSAHSKAQITEEQHEAIAQVMKEMFKSQQASTIGYGQIIHAMGKALESEPVKASTQKVLQGLKELVKNFMKNLELAKEHKDMLHDFLGTLEQTIELQMNQLKKADEEQQNKITQLHDRLSNHMMIVYASLDGAAAKESWITNQRSMLGVITQLIKEALVHVPVSDKMKEEVSARILLGEPVIPEIVNLEQIQEDEAEL